MGVQATVSAGGLTDAKEDPCKGRVNAARLVGLPDVSRGPITKINEDFGLGRSAKRRTVLEAGANPIEAPDPPLRGEGQIVNETKPALSTLDDDAALAYRERVGSVTEDPSEEEVEDLTPLDPKGPGPPLSKEKTSVVAKPEYSRLFNPDELDALEAGRPLPAAEEKEEYDKEIEERLFPLDEVELLKKMKKNAAKEKELTLEELSSLLGLSVETLARTRASSTDELSAPEYWSAWYRRTLAASEEAKRANRDFKAPVTATASTPRVGAVQPDWGDELNAKENDLISDEVMNVRVKESNESPPEPVTDERLVAGNICMAFSGSEVEDLPQEDPAKIPFRLRSLIRTVVYQIVLEEEARSLLRCPACLDADSSPSDDSSTSASTRSYSVVEREARARLLILAAAGVLGDRMMEAVVKQIMESYSEEAPKMRTKRTARLSRCPVHASTGSAPRRVRTRRHVRFDCTSLFAERTEALGSSPSYVENRDDISHYVCRVRNSERPRRRPGLVEVESDDEPEDVFDEELNPVPEGKRVICSVGGLEAVSVGYIEDLPAELLIYTGAVASLVDARFLKRLGLFKAPLRPYKGSLKDVSGGSLRIKGELELTLRMGARYELRTFVVVDRLHVNAILGTYTLKAFRAVIDLDENIMTLKDSGEVIALGPPRVEEMYVTRIASAVRLRPGGQALVVTDVMGQAPDETTVLIEGLPELDANVKIARTLCTVHEGKAVVEVYSASTEDLVLSKGTALAAATVVPKLAFDSLSADQESPTSESNPTPCGSGGRTTWVDSVISAAATATTPSLEPMPGLDAAKEAKLDVDFTDSKLGGEQRVLLADLLGSFRDMVVETSLKPGRTDLLEFSIDTGTQAPIKQRPYRVSQAEGDVMEAEVQQYLELNLIRPSTSPWASPVLMIRKPDGGIRFCIDYRRLNAVTIKDCYPMSLIDDILDVLAGAKLFSTMDIASGYWNVPMAADSVEKTAFTYKYGLFEWLVMPFGLCNAVPAFERLMENVLVDLKWRTCLVYLDDCVVFCSDFPTHLVRLKQVLERFRAAGFKLKMKKCRWGRDQVAFLGHIVTPSGILPNPEKVKAAINVARPHDLHTTRAFLGLTSYFKRYIPGYAAISAPIERLKMKGVEFVWRDDCEAAFLQLQRRLVDPPILAYPDASKRFKLYVDSSRLAVGACLMQNIDGRDRVIAYASKILVGSERNWINKQDGVPEIECCSATKRSRSRPNRSTGEVTTRSVSSSSSEVSSSASASYSGSGASVPVETFSGGAGGFPTETVAPSSGVSGLSTFEVDVGGFLAAITAGLSPTSARACFATRKASSSAPATTLEGSLFTTDIGTDESSQSEEDLSSTGTRLSLSVDETSSMSSESDTAQTVCVCNRESPSTWPIAVPGLC
ncbi:hypothetical protein PR001_g6763 [Phytophthora rubi]|uniref:Reverse transcriptase domain-containing protein n=1 Tax=Phytophthora rubi TaxID=129364 RepID=A0A6A3N6X2_9STRA|nr:hypothetical protein PR002_g7654 [Phytophthora rubi]KAE9041115.1 hypothetical protein PR001_g6763 [Phytophthora rubi]